jgi:O-antigen/teichoic acid export membrane protein
LQIVSCCNENLMKLNNKEFFKLSFLYTAVAAFPPILNLFVRPLIEGDGKLAPVDFSQIEISETIITLVFITATLAMTNAIARFYYDFQEDKKGYDKLISSVFNSILIRGLIILIVAFFLRNYIGKIFSQPELQDFSKYGFAAILVGISRAIYMTAFSLFRNEKKVRMFLILSLLLGILRTVFQLIAVFYYDMSFIGYVYGTCIGSGSVAIIILVFVYRRTGFHYDTTIMKPVNQFAIPLFQYAFIAWGISYADRYFLESSPVVLGIYSQVLNLGRGMEIILQGLQGASQPEMFRLMKDGIIKNMDEIKKLSHLLMAQTQAIIALAIIPAMLYCSIFKTELRQANELISIFFIVYLLRTQYIIFSFPVYFEKKTRIFLYLNIVVLVVNLCLLYFLIPLWQAYGAIAALLSSQIIQVAGIYLYQKKLVQITWNLNKLMIFPFGIILLTILMEIIKLQFDMNPFIFAVILVIAIFSGLWFLYKNEIGKLIARVWR